MGKRGIVHTDRGVALLIVLLVTALLIALIFEFAYGTRVSLRSAVNFRDSQRAYFLARSGVAIFTRFNDLKDLVPEGEWGVVPVISSGDTEVRIKWEDESGKIKINDVRKDGATLEVVRTLFETVKGIDTTVVDGIAGSQSQISNLVLLSGLHEYMNDENYNKVYQSLTVSPVSQNKVWINVNTASAEVLQSLGINASDANRIIKDRQTTPYGMSDFASNGRLSPYIGNKQIYGSNLASYLTTSSVGYYKIFAYATVGGYTKQVEAIIKGNTISYWRAL
jgi:type II secretory pathway component PulK